MKKKNKKTLILITLLVALTLTSCKKIDNQVEEPGDVAVEEEKETSKTQGKDEEEKATKEEAKTEEKIEKAKDLPLVKGAVIGSTSSLVEDRKPWKEFDQTAYDYLENKDVNGFHLPKILLETEDGQAANKEIDELMAHYKSIYEENKDFIEDKDLGFYSSFSVYEDENLLSVYLEANNIWEGNKNIQKIFNFSLPDGTFISDKDLLKEFGVEEEEIMGLMEDGLVNHSREISKALDDTIVDSSFIYNMENLIGLSLNNFWDTYGRDKNIVFVNEVGKPMFLYNQYTNFDAGQYMMAVELGKKSLRESEYSDEYLKMARKLGVDPADENNKGFIIFLGAAYDEDSLKESLSKLYPWQIAFENYKDPGLLVAIKNDPDSPIPQIIGQELYLLVPKYKNSSISLQELELTEEGTLEEVENFYLQSYSVTGPTVICQNISEIAPNAKISLRHRDDLLEFSPSISLKDGSIDLPDQIKDGESVLDWESLVEEDMYSYTIFDRLMSLIDRG